MESLLGFHLFVVGLESTLCVVLSHIDVVVTVEDIRDCVVPYFVLLFANFGDCETVHNDLLSGK